MAFHARKPPLGHSRSMLRHLAGGCRCAAGKMREVIFGKGQPIAAMDDDEETLFRARSAIGPEQIIALARRRSIGLVECRVGGVATEGG